MNSFTRCKPLLGTYVEVSLVADMTENALLDISSAIFAEIEKIDLTMSYHNPNSELSYINHNACHQPCEISNEMEAVLQQALKLSRKTNGIFDITIAPTLVKQAQLPNLNIDVNESANWENIHIDNGVVTFSEKLLIDLGGIAKGYAVDQAFKILDNQPIQAIINAGGDLRMTHWREEVVAIRLPSEPTTSIEIPMKGPAIATSANYFLDNSSAIVSPQTAQPIAYNHSVSVFAKNCMLADALTKVAALGYNESELYRSFEASVVIIDSNGNLSCF